MREKINHYNILSILGEGSSGKVYSAYDTKKKRNIAIKILKTNIDNENVLVRFFKEAQTKDKFDHPHIVTVHEVGKLEDSYFLVMDHIEGNSLKAIMDSREISTGEACQWMVQVLSALNHAHKMSFLHRDIKPSNILIDSENKAHLVDFGLVKVLEKASSNISQGAILGTCAYMPLEQATAEETSKYDERSDIYSIGAVLYELLAKQKVYDSPTILGMVFKLSQGNVESPHEINPETPLHLSQICVKALEKEKLDRFQTAAEMQKSIQDFLLEKNVPIPVKRKFIPKHEWKKTTQKRVFSQKVTFRRTTQKRTLKRDPSIPLSNSTQKPLDEEKLLLFKKNTLDSQFNKKPSSKRMNLPILNYPSGGEILIKGENVAPSTEQRIVPEKKPSSETENLASLANINSQTSPNSSDLSTLSSFDSEPPSLKEIEPPKNSDENETDQSISTHDISYSSFSFSNSKAPLLAEQITDNLEHSKDIKADHKNDNLEKHLGDFIKDRTKFSMALVELDYFEDYSKILGISETQDLLFTILEILIQNLQLNAQIYKVNSSYLFAIVFPQTNLRKAFLFTKKINETLLKERKIFHEIAEHFLPSLSGAIISYPYTAKSFDDLLCHGKNILVQARKKGNLILCAENQRNLSKANFSCPEFVPRNSVWKQIARNLEKNSSQMILIEGKTGVGKTRVSQEIKQRQESDNVFFASCREALTNQPYSAAIHLIDSYLQRYSEQVPAIAKRMWDEETYILKPLIKSFRELKVEDFSSFPPEKTRRLTHQGICFILEYICSKKKIVWVCDNFQWIDQLSLYAFEHVFRRPESNFFLVATLLRKTNPLVHLPYAKMLSRFQLKDYFSIISLGSLSSEEAEKFFSLILKDSYTPQKTFDVLFRASFGNPTYLENVLELLHYQLRLKKDSSQWCFDPLDLDDLPASLDELIELLLKEIKEESIELLEQASLMGESFELENLEKITEKSACEIQDLLEVPEKLGVIEEKEDGKYVFQSAIQDFIYCQRMDEGTRKEGHQKIGETLNACFDPLVDDPAIVAYHLNQGYGVGNAREEIQNFERGRKLTSCSDEYTYIYDGEIKRRIKPLLPENQELTESSLALLKTWMQKFSLAIKQVQRYPAGSDLIKNSITELFQSTDNLWKEIPGFIIKVQPEKLLINACEFPLQGSAINNFYNLLKDHYINQFSCTNDANVEELEKVVSALTVSGQTIVLNPEHWDTFLNESGIEHIDLVQKAYISIDKKQKELGGKDLDLKEAIENYELDKESILLFREVIRYFCASVENIQRYPAESKLLKFSIDLLVKQLGEALEKVEEISFVSVNNDFLINSYVTNENIFGHQVFILNKIFLDQAVNSCSFKKGITRDEIYLFLQQLASPEKKENTFWLDFEKENEINHLTINKKIYQEKEGEEKVDHPKEDSFEDLSIEDKVLHILNMGKEELLPENAKEGLEELLATLSEQNQEDLETLLQKIVDFLNSSLVEMRLHISSFMGEILTKDLPEIHNILLVLLKPEMEKLLQKEENSQVLPKLAKVGQHLVMEQYQNNDFKSCWVLIEKMMDKHKEKLCQKPIEEIMKDLLENSPLKNLPFEFETKDFNKKFFISSFFGAVGKIATESLFNAIGKIAHRGHREKLADVIHSNESDVERYLETKFSLENSFIEISRFSEVLHFLSEEPEKHYQNIITHEDPKVLDLILENAPSLKKDAAISLCRQIIYGEKSESTIVNALLAIEKINSPDSTDFLIEICQKTNKLRIKKVCYRALGSIKDPHALPFLLETANQKAFFGFSEDQEEEKLFAQYALKYFSEEDIKIAEITMEKSGSLLRRITRKMTSKQEALSNSTKT